MADALMPQMARFAGRVAKRESMQRVVPEQWLKLAAYWLAGYDEAIPNEEEE